jgi:hypothetical protein
MPSSFPDAPALLKAAIQYLEDELMPSLTGYHRFKTRVTCNVLGAIQRELEQRDGNAEREGARLVRILGHDGDALALNEELAARIRSSDIALDDQLLRKHIRESLRETLSINNPRWLGR